MIDKNYETDILEKMTIPYVVFPQDSFLQKKMLAWHVLSLTGEEILLASSLGFSFEGFVAGITVNQMEFFLKNAPINYKQELLKAISDKEFFVEVTKIANAMDDDLGEGNTQNQKRVKSVYQYIMDNWEVFKF